MIAGYAHSTRARPILGTKVALWVCILTLGCLSPQAQARTKRSQTAIVEFKKVQPCPATGATKGPCKGYVIDHIKALACGGADDPGKYAMADDCRREAKRQVGTTRLHQG